MSAVRMISLYPGGHVLAYCKASNKVESKKDLRGRAFFYVCGGMRMDLEMTGVM